MADLKTETEAVKNRVRDMIKSVPPKVHAGGSVMANDFKNAVADANKLLSSGRAPYAKLMAVASRLATFY